MTLWLPWLNYGKSYATVAEQIQSTLPANYDCVTADGIGPAQRASFAYLGSVKFAKKNQKHCDYLLVQDNCLNIFLLFLLLETHDRVSLLHSLCCELGDTRLCVFTITCLLHN
jgi:hypothetical protein